jgi:pyruvate-formate lyase-activating enzyme
MNMEKPASHDLLTAVVADAAGHIFDLPGYAAVGMAGAHFEPLTRPGTIGLPFGSELMYLPDRTPILLNLDSGKLEAVAENPHAPGESIYPVAVFNSPGYVITHVAAFRERRAARPLPLFSYGGVGWLGGRFRSAAVRVEWEPRQDLRRMDPRQVQAGVRQLRKRLPRNRLVRHLETCALESGCPAGKNFFLGRYEAPLPTAVSCNARCLGCLSLQKNTGISCTQARIGFTPLPEEIAEAALLHIGRVRRAVVSFGQGCEGEPLTAADAIERAIRLIRSATRRGTINLNTNAGRPKQVARLVAAGLDSIRVSVNSLRPECYQAYFRPKAYGFYDVLRSIDAALERGRFVSINYLNSPGFTDTAEEAEALMAFLEAHPIHMIQWRNLNFDPLRYWKAMGAAAPPGKPLGMDVLIGEIRRRFPKLKFGYFNPPKEKFKIL